MTATDLKTFLASDFSDKIPTRESRDECVVTHDTNPVHCRGDELSPILWQGRQWAVTTEGLERRDGTYFIAAKRLTENIDTPGYGGWPRHMSGKVWVDLEDFITAWLVGLTLYGLKAKKSSIHEAISRARPVRD